MGEEEAEEECAGRRRRRCFATCDGFGGLRHRVFGTSSYSLPGYECFLVKHSLSSFMGNTNKYPHTSFRSLFKIYFYTI